MKKKILMAAMLVMGLTGPVLADDVAFQFANGHQIIWPLKQANATELYSLREGKGYPAFESVLFLSRSHKFQATWGAAAELGTSKAVPFGGANWRLSERMFDTSNNSLLFGFAVAKRFDKTDPRVKSWRGVEVTFKASHPIF